MKTSLDRSDEGHLPSEGICLLRPADRLLNVGGGLRSVMRRFGKHVEHRAEVRADRFSNSITSAFVTSTSPYTWDWNAPESVIMAPENPRNSWRPCRRTDSRCGPLPRMYAFVMRISAWNRFARSAGGMIGRLGFTAGTSAGVRPRGVR